MQKRMGDGFVIGGLLLGAAALFAFVYLLMNGQITLDFASNDTPPVPLGYEKQVGDLAITVTSLVRPADSYLLQLGLPANSPYVDADDQDEMALVYLRIRCVKLTKGCPIDISDFGMRGEPRGNDVPLREGSLKNVGGLFVDSTIRADSIVDGALAFSIERSVRRLTLYYPRYGEPVTFTVQ